jgi:hypothetical protein
METSPTAHSGINETAFASGSRKNDPCEKDGIACLTFSIMAQ